MADLPEGWTERTRTEVKIWAAWHLLHGDLKVDGAGREVACECGELLVLPGGSGKTRGPSPSLVIVDEIHDFPGS